MSETGVLIPYTYTQVTIESVPPIAIRDKTPVLIQTNKVITVSNNNELIRIKPSFTFATEQIHYSWLTKSDEDKLVMQADWNYFVDNIDSSEIVDMIMIVLFSIVLPITACLCKKSIPRFQTDPEKLRKMANLHENRLLLKTHK